MAVITLAKLEAITSTSTSNADRCSKYKLTFASSVQSRSATNESKSWIFLNTPALTFTTRCHREPSKNQARYNDKEYDANQTWPLPRHKAPAADFRAQQRWLRLQGWRYLDGTALKQQRRSCTPIPFVDRTSTRDTAPDYYRP